LRPPPRSPLFPYTTLFRSGAMMVHLGDADGMICGTVGAYGNHLRFIDEVIGHQPGGQTYAAMNILLLEERALALADTHVNDEPRSEEHTSELQSRENLVCR